MAAEIRAKNFAPAAPTLDPVNNSSSFLSNKENHEGIYETE